MMVASGDKIQKLLLQAKVLGPLLDYQRLDLSLRDSQSQNQSVLTPAQIRSFKLTFFQFLNSLQKEDLANLQKFTRPQCFLSISQYLKYLKSRKLKVEFKELEENSIIYFGVVKSAYIYGLPMADKRERSSYQTFQINSPSQNHAKAFFINKSLSKQIREKVFLIDIHFKSTAQATFVKNQQPINRDNDQLYHNYVLQFICKHQYSSLDVPYIIDERQWEHIPFETVDEEEKYQIINTKFVSSQKQEDYQNFGWKINDINYYSNYDSYYDCV